MNYLKLVLIHNINQSVKHSTHDLIRFWKTDEAVAVLPKATLVAGFSAGLSFEYNCSFIPEVLEIVSKMQQ